MAGQVPERIKEERNHDLLEVVDRSARRAGEKLIGYNVEILCEGASRTNRSRLMGRTRTNKIVAFEGESEHIGQLLDVHITHSTGFSLTGIPIERPKHAWANR
jgi:tRNA-2-methylthio-N6-dimethylallyladenosine synthase